MEAQMGTRICGVRGSHPHRKDLTVDQLKQKLLYDPTTGIFTYTGLPRPKIKIGNRAGYIRKDGYREITIGNTGYLEHRLAVLYMTNVWPKEEVDHKNANKSDNSWKNLRQCNIAENNQNILSPKRGNKTNFLGVTESAHGFIARIRVNKKGIYLGTFSTKKEAYDAYLTAKRELHVGNLL